MNGIELIKEEREQQLQKHNINIEDDVKFNNEGQLASAAIILLNKEYHDKDLVINHYIPKGWNEERWEHIINKPYKERVIIAGAFTAAIIDTIQYEFKNLIT